MRMLGRWSLLGFSVAIAAPGMIAARVPDADWRGTWMLYGIAAGLFAAALWLMFLDGHFRLNRWRRHTAATMHRWNERRNVRVGPVTAPTGTSATSNRKTADSAPQRAQTPPERANVHRVTVPPGASVSATLQAYARSLGMTAYISDSVGYILSDGAQVYPCEVIRA